MRRVHQHVFKYYLFKKHKIKIHQITSKGLPASYDTQKPFILSGLSKWEETKKTWDEKEVKNKKGRMKTKLACRVITRKKNSVSVHDERWNVK